MSAASQLIKVANSQRFHVNMSSVGLIVIKVVEYNWFLFFGGK